MCGIVGAIAQRNIMPVLMAGLARLEYRGYDSAGVAVLDGQATLRRERVQGKVESLTTALRKKQLTGRIGIAHTRWATHGKPSIENAHPHSSTDDTLTLVHNGIIENHDRLRGQLQAQGYVFSSQTDTEVIVHLLHEQLQTSKNFQIALQAVVAQLEGAYALVILNANEPDKLWCVRKGSPLVIGLGIEENFIASDQLALLPVTQRFIYLEEGDIACVAQHQVSLYDAKGNEALRTVHESQIDYDSAARGKYRHYMQKEIFEQPTAVKNTLVGRMSDKQVLPQCFGVDAEKIFKAVEHVHIVACGTSFHAGLIGHYWFEALAGVSTQTEIASEFRYRNPAVPKNTLLVTLSQSGETADTLAALRNAKEGGYLSTLAICNVPESSIVRESDLCFMTHAGIEVGVASTKAFTTQLVALLLLTLSLSRDKTLEHATIGQLHQLPGTLEKILQLDKQITTLAERFANKQHALFLGRGLHYPIAMEGALKLKEISYIHAEAYAAGELKHGPLALIDDEMPVVAIAPNDELLEKLKANLEEVRARGGELIVFADEAAKFETQDNVTIVSMPSVDTLLAPIAYTLPLQLLAYHVAVLKGTDVDQPRNLAKSVTVE